MNRIYIKGIIGTEYDKENRAENDPVITTSKDFSDALNNAGNDVTICIDSYGGNIEEANKMLISLSQWLNDDLARNAVIEVGAVAFSAAANMIALAPKGVKIVVYPSSQIMYHSCRCGVTDATPDEMRDTAKSMDSYNNAVIGALIAKTNLPETEIRAWFEAGREGYLSGKNAVDCGLANGFVNDDITPFTMPQINAEKFKLVALSIAKYNKIKGETEMDLEHKPVVIPEDEEKEKVETIVADVEKKETENDCVAEGETTVEETEEETTPNEIDALKAEIEALKAEIEAIKEMIAKPVTTACSVPKMTVAKAVCKTFPELVKEIPQGISEREYNKRFNALKETHAVEYKAYMDSHKALH